jgi:predicted dehydrogenase
MKHLENNRRQFIAISGAASLSLGISGQPVQAAPRDRLRLASVGVGGMGASDLDSLRSHPKVDVVAICDIDANNLAAAGEKCPNAKRYSDFRKMIAEMGSEIDAVNVATPDHTHAAASMTAMNAGKHVYCQKPLTHDIYEARQMRLVAEKQKVVTQMGTQIHSASAYRSAVKLIQSGAIGLVREVHSWSGKTWGYEGPLPAAGEVPKHVDWDLWIGTAPFRPFAEGHYHPANWRKWYDFGCGTMGDMAIHILDPVFSALKLGAPRMAISTSPEPPKQSYGIKNQVRLEFPASKFTTDGFVLSWSDGGLMPDTTGWPLPSGASLPDQGSMFVGEKGYVLLPHIDMPKLLPEATFKDFKYEPAPDGNHYHLWVDACLGGSPTTADFTYAGPLTEAVLLGVLANRFPGKKLTWESEAMKIPDHPAANALVRRKYRDGWSIPNLS